MVSQTGCRCWGVAAGAQVRWGLMVGPTVLSAQCPLLFLHRDRGFRESTRPDANTNNAPLQKPKTFLEIGLQRPRFPSSPTNTCPTR